MQVTARFRAQVASSRVAGYSLQLSTPSGGCADRAQTTFTPAGGLTFRAGEVITLNDSIMRCTGTYQGDVVLKPRAGPSVTVGRFSFKAGPHR